MAAVTALAPYLTAIRSHARLIAAIALTAMIASLAWTQLHGDSYEATAGILVVPTPADDLALAGLPLLRSGEADTTRAVGTAATLLRSSRAAELAARRSGGTLSEQTVESGVTVEAQPDSDLVEVRATADDPQLAAQMANLYAEAALALRKGELEPQVAGAKEATREALASVRDQSGATADSLRARLSALKAVSGDPALFLAREAHAPSAATGSPTWLVAGIALIGGLVLGIVTAMLSEVLAPRVLRDEEDIAHVLPGPVLARMPDALGRPARGDRGRRRAAAYREALRSVRGQLEVRADDRRLLSLEDADSERAGGAALVTSPSRGDGHPGVARALARAFADARWSVILIDLDLHRAGSKDGDLGGSKGLWAVTGGQELKSALEPLDGAPGVRTLSPPPGLPFSAIERMGASMPAILAEARREADWVIVDAPPLGEVSDALGALTAVDELVIIVRRNHTELTRLARLRDLLRSMGVLPTGFLVVGGVRIADANYYEEDDAPLTRSPQEDEASLPG